MVLQFSVNEDLQLEVTGQVVFFCSDLGVTEGLVFRVSDVLEHNEERSLLGNDQVGFCGLEGQLSFAYDGRAALYQCSHSGVIETRLNRSQVLEATGWWVDDNLNILLSILIGIQLMIHGKPYGMFRRGKHIIIHHRIFHLVNVSRWVFNVQVHWNVL